MKCPFRVKTFTHREFTNGKAVGNPVEVRHCYYEECHGDECPYFYRNDEDIDHCARCDGGPEDL
jgi:hypothetical protein